MTEVMSAEEYARSPGRSLEDIEAMIAEAESDSITRDMMDPGTLKPAALPPETKARAVGHLRQAGYQI